MVNSFVIVSFFFFFSGYYVLGICSWIPSQKYDWSILVVCTSFSPGRGNIVLFVILLFLTRPTRYEHCKHAYFRRRFAIITLLKWETEYMGYWPSLLGQDVWISASFFFCRVYGPRRSQLCDPGSNSVLVLLCKLSLLVNLDERASFRGKSRTQKLTIEDNKHSTLDLVRCKSWFSEILDTLSSYELFPTFNILFASVKFKTMDGGWDAEDFISLCCMSADCLCCCTWYWGFAIFLLQYVTVLACVTWAGKKWHLRESGKRAPVETLLFSSLYGRKNRDWLE